jgi:hypothetical protein
LQRVGNKKAVLIMVAYRGFKQQNMEKQNMEDESVTSPLANEKGNKRHIVDSIVSFGPFGFRNFLSSLFLSLKPNGPFSLCVIFQVGTQICSFF